MIFPFPFIFTLLFDPHSIRTVFLFHSHVTSPWGSPCSPYLWLTSLEACFPFYSCTALHCLTLPGTALWLVLTPLHLEAAPPLYFPPIWLVMTWLLSFTGLPFALPSMYKLLNMKRITKRKEGNVGNWGQTAGKHVGIGIMGWVGLSVFTTGFRTWLQRVCCALAC